MGCQWKIFILPVIAVLIWKHVRHTVEWMGVINILPHQHTCANPICSAVALHLTQSGVQVTTDSANTLQYQYCEIRILIPTHPSAASLGPCYGTAAVQGNQPSATHVPAQKGLEVPATRPAAPHTPSDAPPST